MITETTSPPAICFSRNQIPLKLTVSPYSTEGVFEKIDFALGLPDTDGDTMQLEWSYDGTDYDVTFTFQTTPTAADYEIETYSGATTAAFVTWINDVLVPGVMSHPDVNEHFQTEFFSNGSDFGITFKAVYEGDYSLVMTATGFTRTIASDTSGVMPVKRENHTVYLRIALQNDLTDTLVQYLRLPQVNFSADPDNAISIDLQPYIDDYFRNSEIPPLPTTKSYTRCTKINRFIYAEYGEQYGDPVAKQYAIRTDAIRVLQGGVATHDFPDIRADIADWLTEDSTDDTTVVKFLTNRKKRILYGLQPDWLFAYIPADLDYNVRVRIKRYFADGTDSSVTDLTWTNSSNVAGGNTIYIPIDPGAIGQILIPANCISYEINLEDIPITWKTETITVVRRTPETGHTVLEYQNTLGAWETISLPWNKQRVAEVAKSFYETRRSTNYPTAEASRISFNEMLMETFTITLNQNLETGREWLPEILLSPEVYLNVGGWKNGKRIPCTISPDAVNQELQNESGTHFKSPKLTIRLDRQIAFSRIINLTDLCEL